MKFANGSNFKRVSLISDNKDTNLEIELSATKVCIFRSSAVGIQGMQYGVIPIFCSSFPSPLLDPLYPVGQMGEYKDLGPLLKELSDFRNIGLISPKKTQRIKEVGMKYFAKPSSDTLDWISQL